MMNRNCESLMRRVYVTGFMLDDLILYLDTHPCDPRALECYKRASQDYADAVGAFENQCGPLTIEGVQSDCYWTWVENPWPWEGGCE